MLTARRACKLALLLAFASPTAASALPVLSHHGRWLTDPSGRVVILHGVQIDKYLGDARQGGIDLEPSNVRFIAAQGFNLARVSLYYSGVEPSLGRFDDNYVDQFLSFDRQLSAAGIFDLVDMMQGQYAAEFYGSGFPAWMVQTDGLPNIPGPFPQSYLYDPAEERAWDNFWANAPAADGVGLQDHYAAGLARLARSFARSPGFLGFDLMNEPWPGSQYPTCVNPLGCPLFDQSLRDFYRRIVPVIRGADVRHPVFYEPHALFDEGSATNIGSIGDPNAVFTFHSYCLGDQPGLPQADPGQDCGIEEELVLAEAEAQAQRAGDGLLEDEWGNTASVPLLERMGDEADEHMVGWAYWAYEDCCGSPGAVVHDGAKPAAARGNLNVPVLRALVRPYPKIIAGTPTSWRADHARGSFSLAYAKRRVAGGPLAGDAETEVELPALQYPTGYEVRVTGARVVSAPDANLLRLRNLPGEGAVSLAVSRARHHPEPGDAIARDCPASSRHSLAVRRSGRRATATRVRATVDGRPVFARRGHEIRTVRLPPGLAEGSVVRLGMTIGGRHVVTTRVIRDCVLA